MFWNEPYVRFASEVYDCSKGDAFVHLVNNSITKEHAYYKEPPKDHPVASSGFMWDISQLDAYLREKHPHQDDPPADFEKEESELKDANNAFPSRTSGENAVCSENSKDSKDEKSSVTNSWHAAECPGNLRHTGILETNNQNF